MPEGLPDRVRLYQRQIRETHGVTWLGLWTPELGKAHTAVIVREVDALPTWAAEQVRDLVVRSAPTAPVPFAVTAEHFEDIPSPLASLVDTVVQVPSLRDRPDDVLPLAAHIAARELGMSRATLYRKISQYSIHIPREAS